MRPASGRGRTLADFIAIVAGAMPRIDDPKVKNAVQAAICGIYWKFGRDKANQVIDHFELGRHGWTRITL